MVKVVVVVVVNVVVACTVVYHSQCFTQKYKCSSRVKTKSSEPKMYNFLRDYNITLHS